MKVLFNVIIYGFLGYWLERVINIIFLGYWLDNSVLWLPVQPMYGVGVALTLVCYQWFRKRQWAHKKLIVPLAILAILFTWASEMFSGTMYENLYGRLLWDYRYTFSLWCHSPYSCIIPTAIFGLIATIVAVYLHPFVENILFRIPVSVKYTIIGMVVMDFILTYKDAFFVWVGVSS